jgi:hypothetical protein
MLQYSPKIITDSLVMCLDASQNKSYPTDLPVKGGLALWLDASDDTTFSYSSGTSVSQWRDKSGNNFHATQALSANQPSRSTTQNSRKTVNFDGTNDTVTIPNFVCNSEISIFVVSNCGTTLLIEHSTDTNSNQGFYFYGGGNGMIYITRSTGSIISNTNWLSGGYSIASAVNSTGLDLLTYKNGTQQTIITDGRSSLTNSFVTNTLYIGSRGANSLWSSGPIAEIIIYNRKVTNAERNLIHTYLGQKWGISNTDRSVVDLAGNDDNGLLGNGSTSNMPLYDYYNKGSFKFFASNKYIKLGISTVVNQFAGDFTVSLWAMATAENSNYGNLIGDYYTAGAQTTAEWQIMMNNSSAFLNLYRVGTGYIINNTSSGFSANTWINVVLTRVGTAVTLYANNNVIGTATNSLVFGSATGSVNIGVDGNNSAEPFSGLISNVLIYRKGLSAVEVAQNYEAQKSKFANTIVQQGLLLNLDAGNPYSYAGAGAAWYDVSGNGYVSSLTNTQTYNSDNGGSINFNGSTESVSAGPNSNLFLADMTAEVWIKITAMSGDWVRIIGTGSDPRTFGLWYYVNGRILWQRTGSSAVNPEIFPATPVLTVGSWAHVAATTIGMSHVLYLNGVSIGTNPSAGGPWGNSNTAITIGYAGYHAYSNSNIASARLYTRGLSAAEILQNYNATKGRFGL